MSYNTLIPQHIRDFGRSLRCCLHQSIGEVKNHRPRSIGTLKDLESIDPNSSRTFWTSTITSGHVWAFFWSLFGLKTQHPAWHHTRFLQHSGSIALCDGLHETHIREPRGIPRCNSNPTRHKKPEIWNHPIYYPHILAHIPLSNILSKSIQYDIYD